MIKISIIIAIVQINIALGILYVGLPKFRFRDNIYNDIVNILNANPFVDLIEERRDRFERLLMTDSEFSGHYHDLRIWLRKLPDYFRDKIQGSERFKIMQHEHAPRSRLDHAERGFWWFEVNGDKKTVWISSIIPSIFLLWWMLLDEGMNYEYLPFPCFLIQIVLLSNAYLGYRLSHKIRQLVRSKLKIVTDRLNKKDVDEALP